MCVQHVGFFAVTKKGVFFTGLPAEFRCSLKSKVHTEINRTSCQYNSYPFCSSDNSNPGTSFRDETDVTTDLLFWKAVDMISTCCEAATFYKTLQTMNVQEDGHMTVRTNMDATCLAHSYTKLYLLKCLKVLYVEMGPI